MTLLQRLSLLAVIGLVLGVAAHYLTRGDSAPAVEASQAQ